MMNISLEITCPHLSSSVREVLNADTNNPTLATCLGCAQVRFNGVHLEPELPMHDKLPFKDSDTLGSGLFGGRLGADRFGLGLHSYQTETGMIAMLINGQPAGSIYVIRQTSDGPVLLFPGSSATWWNREVHPMDCYWFFGDEFADDRIRSGQATVYDLLKSGVVSGNLDLRVRSLIRLG